MTYEEAFTAVDILQRLYGHEAWFMPHGKDIFVVLVPGEAPEFFDDFLKISAYYHFDKKRRDHSWTLQQAKIELQQACLAVRQKFRLDALDFVNLVSEVLNLTAVYDRRAANGYDLEDIARQRQMGAEDKT